MCVETVYLFAEGAVYLMRIQTVIFFYCHIPQTLIRTIVAGHCNPDLSIRQARPALYIYFFQEGILPAIWQNQQVK